MKLRPVKGSTRKASNMAPLSQSLDHRANLVHLVWLGSSVSEEGKTLWWSGCRIFLTLTSFIEGCVLGWFSPQRCWGKSAFFPSAWVPPEEPPCPVSVGLWGSRFRPATASFLWGRGGKTVRWPQKTAEMSAEVGRVLWRGAEGQPCPFPSACRRQGDRARQNSAGLR